MTRPDPASRPARKLRRKRQLPRRPSAAQLRKRAKELLQALHAGDAKALARAAASHPTWKQAEGAAGLALHDAQWVLAREYGFASWARLLAHVHEIEEIQARVSTLEAPELVELLAKRDWRARVPVESTLFQMQGDVMDALLAGMRHENPRIRTLSAQLMDHKGDDRCIEPLRALLGDPVPKVRAAALHSLQCQRCKPEPLAYDVVPDLIRTLREDPSPGVRRGAIGGMWIQPPDLRLVEPLEELLRDPEAADWHRGAEASLRIHLEAVPTQALLERAEHGATEHIRSAAIFKLAVRPPDAAAAVALAGCLERETDEILRRRTERAWRHHAEGSSAA